jgi:Cu(I)/Ag(I) efflux system membrane fusion protein/cobalt-zinc-cadmium efflux system membrane fusion protein
MNKYVVRTSVVWIVFIAIFGVIFFVRTRTQAPSGRSAMRVQPVAVAPIDQANRQSTPASGRAPALAPVQLSAERMQSIGIETAVVERTTVNDDIRATGTVAINDRLLSYVQVRFSGYIRKVFANAPLQFVRQGDPLFTIYSPELVAAENEYLVALRNRNRLQSSTIEGISSGATDLVNGAGARLRQWDVPESVIGQVAQTGFPVSEMLVTAPTSGYITERNALPNLYVEPATRLYTLAELSQVWVEAQLFPEDMGRVKPGDPVDITLDAYPGRKVRGHIETVLPQVDMATRTGRVRIDLPNPGVRFKPGMYVSVDLKVGLGQQIVVPASAVLMTGTRSVAFLYRADGQLIPQDVEPGQTIGDKLIILKGLSPGQRVVSSANFLVDSESQLQAASGAFAPPPPGAGTTAQPAEQQVNIDFTTLPSPPQKGNNRFRVRLTDSSGKPVTDASVTAVFYMAAMPAMGMAAMTTKSDLQPSGSGVYAGSGVLQSGGTWQVTITVRRGGSVIGTKQLNVSATGGM